MEAAFHGGQGAREHAADAAKAPSPQPSGGHFQAQQSSSGPQASYYAHGAPQVITIPYSEQGSYASYPPQLVRGCSFSLHGLSVIVITFDRL